MSAPAKRGRGRPPLDPTSDGPAPHITVRLTLAGFERLRAIIAAGHATGLAEAARWAIERAKVKPR